MKGEFYARDTKVMLRVSYEFGFINYKTMEGAHPCMCMTDMKREVGKSKSSQRHMRIASLSHMDNMRKEAKNVYFGMLG